MSALILLVILFVVIAVLAVVARSEIRVRRREREIDSLIPLDHEAVFEGIYIPHWEVARFEWHVTEPIGKGFSTYPLCALEWDESVQPGLVKSLATSRKTEPRHRLVFRGAIVEKGHFGHRGICRYRVKVHSVVSDAIEQA